MHEDTIDLEKVYCVSKQLRTSAGSYRNKQAINAPAGRMETNDRDRRSEKRRGEREEGERKGPAWDGTGCEFDSWQCRI